jgi:hypothetical protein
MASPERIYSSSVRVFSLVLLALGVAILLSTLLGGGGPASVGFLLGIAFIAVGGGRLWLSSRMGG